MAFSCRYAASGKKAGRPKRALPVVTASHRSVIAWRKASESVLGKARVCGRAPAPGATGSGAGDEAALACGAALPVGLAAGGVRGDPVPVALALAGAEGTGERPPHPASRTAAMAAAASCARRDHAMPS